MMIYEFQKLLFLISQCTTELLYTVKKINWFDQRILISKLENHQINIVFCTTKSKNKYGCGDYAFFGFGSTLFH